MTLSEFSLHRPVASIVMSLVIVLLGAVDSISWAYGFIRLSIPPPSTFKQNIRARMPTS